jgi:hypothetical protein
MKKFYIIVISLVFTLFFSAQAAQFRIISFDFDAEDLSAIRFGRSDVNDDACAIIKIFTDIENLHFDARLGIEGNVVKKEGEYWIYVSPLEKQIKLSAQGFVTLEYNIPIRIESAKVYKLSLTALDIPTSEEIPEIVLFESEPSNAELYIDGKLKGFTPMDLALPQGKYQVVIRKPLYENNSFEINVISGKTIAVKKILEQQSSFGTITIEGGNDAKIFVDDMLLGNKLYNGQLAVGTHNIKIEYADCNPYFETIHIEAGKQLIIDKKCVKPINVSSTRDFLVETNPKGAQIYKNGLYVGISPLTITIDRAETNQLRIEMNGYKTQSAFIRKNNSKSSGYYVLESLNTGINTQQNRSAKIRKRPTVGLSIAYAMGNPGGGFGGINLNLGANKQLSVLGEMAYQFNYFDNEYIQGYVHFSDIEIGFAYNIWISNWFLTEMRIMYVREKAFSIPWNETSAFYPMPEYLLTDNARAGLRIGLKIQNHLMLFGGAWISMNLKTTRDEWGSFPFYNNEILNYNTIFPNREGYGYDFGVRFVF